MTRALLPLVLLAAAPAAAQTFTGTLAPTDPTRDGGARYDSYTFQAREGQQVKVRMTSDAFDTYLIVKGPTGQEFTNDDFEGTSVSQLEFVAGQGGAWTVWASSFNDTGAGDYAVEVTPGRIARIETVEGRLDPRDRQLPKGEFYDLVERPIAAGSPFTVELRAYGFDGYLVLESPSGKFYRNDDAEGGMDDGQGGTISRLADVAPESGAWKVYVTTATGDALGAYDLRFITFPN